MRIYLYQIILIFLVLFFKHDSADLPSYKSYSNNLQLINCLIKCVISESNNLSFSLLSEFQDIRPFSW
jgi:hypothetical protein